MVRFYKNFLVVFVIIFSNINLVLAFEEEYINVQVNEIKKFEVPVLNDEVFSPVNQKGEFVSKDYDSDYFEADDEVFETKSGQIFGKFIDDKVINNKFINYSNRLKNN